MHTPLLSWQLVAIGTSRAPRRQPTPRWQRALIALHPAAWPAAVAASMVLGLLLAFQQVVAQGVEQAEQRHKVTAAQVERAWRCRLLRSPADRDHCLAQIGTEMAPMSPSPSSRLAAMALPALAQPLEK
jgi:aspartate aminotransferase-like enzyme